MVMGSLYKMVNLDVSIFYSLVHCICISVMLPPPPPPPPPPPQDGDTPLHCAARLGHMICVQELLTVPDVDAKVCNNRGMTPEMCAAEGGGGGKEAVVEWLQRSKPAPSSRECSRVILCGNTGSGKSTLAQVCPVLPGVVSPVAIFTVQHVY